jgi:trafficking protein particle complex subunit 9
MIDFKVAPLVFSVDVNAEPADHIILEGALADIPIGRLGCGESRELEMAVCFLSFGRFEIKVDVRVSGSVDGGKVGTDGLGAVVKEAG